jgi:hypothetical protein
MIVTVSNELLPGWHSGHAFPPWTHGRLCQLWIGSRSTSTKTVRRMRESRASAKVTNVTHTAAVPIGNHFATKAEPTAADRSVRVHESRTNGRGQECPRHT